MRTFLLALALLSAGAAVAVPEAPHVWPTPQQITFKTESFLAPTALAIQPAEGFDPAAKRLLRSQRFAVTEAAPFTLRWSLTKDLPQEGYTLELTAQGATLAAADAVGLYYGTQTLCQLLANDRCFPAAVKDWPDTPFRGIVEGYYGQPWSFEARKRMFAFMGQNKMNIYIYGPKDDPYHGFGPKWRNPYPADKAREIALLVEAANRHHVTFVWAVHPGKSITWKDDRDIRACIDKFQLMYDLGVRAYAIFFDDISGEGTRADKQIELLNTVNREFIRKKGDVAPLIMCPTDYAAAWAKGTYLERLGENLDHDIRIFWTGDAVCSDITRATVDHVSPRIRRKPFIWWNWPVCDYCKPHLLMGRCYGVDPANVDRLAGLVSNPMDKPEASKIPLFGVAACAWNPDDFDSERAWRDAIRRTFPEVAASVQTLADHNSAQGPKAEGFNREESVAIAPIANRILEALDAKKEPAQADLQALNAEFRRIQAAGADILGNCKNKTFVEEVHDWADLFTRFGAAGAEVTNALLGNVPAERALAALDRYHADHDAISARHAKKPFSEGIVVASQVLTPLLSRLETHLRGQRPANAEPTP